MINKKAAYPSTSFPLTHIERMTDSIGILEHCIFSTPDRIEGYSTDDNARALQVVLRLNKLSSEEYIKKYSSIYLQFLLSARSPQGFH
ncbi:MAG: glycosyltransferase, partial [Candidatus Roizmanbacteria bacterium]|nr:glycosyltransferase [Candidatus Roizmanbacteria bacterium]